MSVRASEASGVQVIRRSAQILESLRGHPEGLSLSEIAAATGLARSTIHRLVRALEEERLVAPAAPRAGYRIGPAIAALAASIELPAVARIHPHLVRLSRELDEAVDLAVLEHDRVRFVDQVPAAQRLRAVSSVGAVFPAYCTANGKALLALQPRAAVARLLPELLPAITANTTTSRERLLDELDAVSRDGVAFDREEHTEGICAVGVAVEPAPGSAFAVTVPMPAQRFGPQRDRIAGKLLALRDEVERETRRP